MLLTLVPFAAGPAVAMDAPNTDKADTPRLQWKACDTQAGFDCAMIQVPLDYRQPKGRIIELSVIRLKAADPAQRIGSLFFNPGGPGGAGTIALPKWKKIFPAGLRGRFDLVSWDPRGINDSTSVQCFDTNRETS